MLACLVRELRSRLESLRASPEAATKATNMGWLQDGKWSYLQCSPAEKRLKVNPLLDPVTMETMHRQLARLEVLLQGEVIQKFTSTKAVAKLQENEKQATFLLEVSTLGNPAWEVHQILQALVGSAVLSLVGGQLKKATQRRSDLAQRLQKLVLGGNGV